jgi:hypothetical protein
MTKRFMPVALDLEDVKIADKRLEKLQTGKTRTVPLSRLVRKYGVDRGQSGTPSNRQSYR